MEPPASDKPRDERDDTDESLRSEREKTDEELVIARAVIEQDADRVVELARLRADAVLTAVRDRTDAELESSHASIALKTDIVSERADEDRSLEHERASADAQLHVEREQRKAVLESALLREREATDGHLQLERAHSDATVATRDEFLGMVSHDLRTLLGGIAMNAALLAKHASAEGDIRAEALHRADRIQRFTGRMSRLIGDLLDLVSLEAGKLDVAPTQRDAVQLVRDAMEAFQPTFAAKGLQLSAEIERGSILAEFDHERILQVLANLLSNALKFTSEGGRVNVLVAPSGTDVLFSVTDSGIGFPAADVERIFERFRQVKRGDRRGLGLGLYIARCIVETHGGRIWAELPEGGGAAFHFTLPGVAR